VSLQQIKQKLIYSIAAVFVVTVFFIALLKWFNRKLQSDMDYFITFLKKAVFSEAELNRDAIKFEEFDTMAQYANKMLADRIEVTRSLTQSEAQMHAIITSNANPIVVYDDVGYPEFVNPAFSQVFGWTIVELRGKRIPFVPGDQMELTAEKIRHIYTTGSAVKFATRRLTKEGRLLEVIVSAALIRNPQGRNTGMVVNLIDITEQQKLETQLRQAQKMESIGRLAGGVAHDFNNMLSIIIGNAEMAMDEVQSGSRTHQKLQEILNAGMRSAEVTRQLLAFARKQTIALKIIDLNEAIGQMLKMLRRLIGEDIDLVWKPEKGIWPVSMDPSQLDQVLTNLCVNSRDAIHDVGRITIETGEASFDYRYCKDHPGFLQGDFVVLTVSDTGQGMDEKTKENLFEPFFTTKNIGKGTGLGMATVYGIVTQNSGFINVLTEPGSGCSFSIYLPRYQQAASGFDSGEPGSDSEEHLSTAGQETILLVEDDPAILSMTKTILEQQGYTVFAGNMPDDALQLATRHQGAIDLLITDVIMPGMNGRKLATRVSSLQPGIKCLFISGYTADVIAHHGVLDGGLQFLQKPFSRKDLLDKVRAILE
jgi:PAS domain S-box-containing protein